MPYELRSLAATFPPDSPEWELCSSAAETIQRMQARLYDMTDAAKRVMEEWETGDLAAAVRRLNDELKLVEKAMEAVEP